MAKDRFGHGVNDGGTFMSRSLHSMVPQIAMMGGQAGVILATQMDTRRPAYTAMVKELKKMARPGLNFTSINTSASPFEPLINPAKGAHYQPQTNTVATAQRGITHTSIFCKTAVLFGKVYKHYIPQREYG